MMLFYGKMMSQTQVLLTNVNRRKVGESQWEEALYCLFFLVQLPIAHLYFFFVKQRLEGFCLGVVL